MTTSLLHRASPQETFQFMNDSLLEKSLAPTFIGENEPLPSNTLGAVSFGHVLEVSGGHSQPPVITVPMASAADHALIEAWVASTGSHVEYGEYKGLVFGDNGHFLFCAGVIPSADTYHLASEQLYDHLFELLAIRGYPTLFRLWNYIGDLLSPNAQGMEIYRDFVQGRARSFSKQASGTWHIPAATGIGTRGSGIGVVALATRDAHAIHIENPRQVSAYHYPKEYGPRSPSFARATALIDVTPDADLATLSIFISGTASILGHETVFKGDIAKQTQTTLDNIAAILSPDNLSSYQLDVACSLKEVKTMRVYVKYEDDIDTVRNIIATHIGSDTHVSFFNVDVCREDLLVEIEAFL